MTFRKAASGATHLGRGAAMASKQHTRGACKTGPTTGQRRAWEEMRVLSEAWNIVTEEHRLAWNAAARANRRGDRKARSRRRSGRRLFFRANSYGRARRRSV